LRALLRHLVVGSAVLLSGAAAAGAPVSPGPTPSPEPQKWWGPLFTEFDLTLQIGSGTEALGPLWGSKESDGVSTWRISPLFSRETEPQLDRAEWEVLYPFVSYDRFGTEWKVQFLQMLHFSGGSTLDGDIKKRQTLFPIYFRQESPGGTNDYLSIAPFYGHFRNRLFRDEVRFALFPLWLETRKREVVTQNYLAPFFHLRRGGGVEGWQLWPVVGSESKPPTYRTNVIDELELVPGHERRFFAWPLYFNERSGLGGPNPTTNLFLFPTHLRTRSPEMDHTWWLFFSHRTNRVKQFEEWAYPWPFLGRSRGPGKHSDRIFPIWGKATNANQQSDFIAWPLYIHKRTTTPTFERERHRFLYFGYSDLREEDRTTGRALRRRDLWPLFTWRKDREGRERLQVLAPLEGVFPSNKTIDRLYSPVWSLWRSESNEATHARSQSLLWNLWRRDQDHDYSRTAAFFGLVQTEHTPGRRTWRILGLGPRQQRPARPAITSTTTAPPRAFLTLAPRDGQP
jgi:hypothetical protein